MQAVQAPAVQGVFPAHTICLFTYILVYLSSPGASTFFWTLRIVFHPSWKMDIHTGFVVWGQCFFYFTSALRTEKSLSPHVNGYGIDSTIRADTVHVLKEFLGPHPWTVTKSPQFWYQFIPSSCKPEILCLNASPCLRSISNASHIPTPSLTVPTVQTTSSLEISEVSSLFLCHLAYSTLQWVTDSCLKPVQVIGYLRTGTSFNHLE